MGFMDSLKGIFTVSEGEDFDEEEEFLEETEEEEEPKATAKGGFFSGKASARTADQGAPAQMQVVLVKPERFDDGISIADHLNQNKTVVLNLENADRDTCRRLLDFLSGAAYVRRGNIKKVSRSTYIITPNRVSVMGDVLAEEYENSDMMF